ncbi:hypothetical protein FI667_g15922, partial [Globisporangium splendens]
MHLQQHKPHRIHHECHQSSWWSRGSMFMLRALGSVENNLRKKRREWCLRRLRDGAPVTSLSRSRCCRAGGWSCCFLGPVRSSTHAGFELPTQTQRTARTHPKRNDDKNLKLLLTPDHPNLLDELRQCPDVDIFVPSGVRGFGYCGDAVAYAKYTDRAFNHYWDGIPDAPDFPKDKPVYLMPNVGMYELNESHFWNYAQEGNPRNTQVFYTRHTSSDVANYARRKLGGDAIAKKGFENVRFIHTVGGSAQKGTNEVIECWLSRPDFPQLDLLASDEAYINMFEKPYGDRIPGSKINLTEHCLPAIPFGKVIAEASFFLCPSRMEGYGHYINQARAMLKLWLFARACMHVVPRTHDSLNSVSFRWVQTTGSNGITPTPNSPTPSLWVNPQQITHPIYSLLSHWVVPTHPFHFYEGHELCRVVCFLLCAEAHDAHARRRRAVRARQRGAATGGQLAACMEQRRLLRGGDGAVRRRADAAPQRPRHVDPRTREQERRGRRACERTAASDVIPYEVGLEVENEEEDAEAQTRRLVINENDPQALEKLRECPDIDVFLPTGSRGHGYCEDASVYVKFLKTRMLPRWVFDATFFDAATSKNVTYFELCPQTPVIFFNHYWDGLTDSPAWPKQKPVYLMPNVEMYELTAEHYWRVDVVLCKTQTCYDRVTKWYAQEGNPRESKVIYTKHTTSDVANLARHVLGANEIRPKDYRNVKFIHTAGTSVQKGTRQVVQCWLSRPDFPPLDLFINAHTYKGMFSAKQDARIRASSNINLTNHRMDPITFGKAIAEASFFLCPSVMEGYGHYINQARASGGVVVTTDVAPMNELIPSRDFGVLVKPTKIGRDGHMLLAGAYTGEHGIKPDVVQGLSAQINKAGVCAAIEQVILNTTVWSREAMAANVRRQYHMDTKFFALEMLKLRQFAARQRSAAKTTRNHLRQQPQQDSQQLNELGQW